MGAVAYLCSYIPMPEDPRPYSYDRSPLGEARIISRGLACLESELLTELETACRAKRGSLSFDKISAESIEAWREHAKENGSRIFLNREGYE